MITTRIELDVSPGGIAPMIHVSQYDSGSRTLIFDLISGSGDLILPNGVKAEIRGTKSDGNGFSYEAVISEKTVTADVTEQMTAAAGKAVCELVLYTGTPASTEAPASNDFTQLCTANFILLVERAALDKDTLKSGSEIRQLLNVIDRTEEILEAADIVDTGKQEIEQQAVQSEEKLTQLIEEHGERIERLTKWAESSAHNALNASNEANKALVQVNVKAEQIAALSLSAETISAQALEKATNAENESAEVANSLDTVNQNTNVMRLLLENKIDDAYVENGYLYLTSGGDIKVGPLGPFSGSGGSGGSSGNNVSLSLVNKTGWLSRTIALGESLPITINWNSIEDGLSTGNGTMKITVAGSVKSVLDISQGDVTVDVAPYLSVGSSIVKINVADIYGNNRTLNFSITVVLLTLTSSFDDSIAYTGPISFPYIPTGNVQKTIHFVLDGVEIGSTSTAVSGRQQSFTISQQPHGNHVFQCYFEADINGQTVRSNELYYEIICLEALNTTPVLTCSFHEKTVRQYTTVHVGYSVYNPYLMVSVVTIKVNGKAVAWPSVDRTKQDFSMRMDEVGEYTVEIWCGDIVRSVTFNVIESDIHIEAESDNLALYLSSIGRNNTDPDRSEWSFGEISAALSGFNFASDGWKKDESGIAVLRVSGDARVTIPYKLFGTDFRTTGKTIELEFATRNVMNYETVILSCFSGGRGLQLTAQNVELNSEQSKLSMQFKENEHVRVSFVIEKRSENRLAYCYINGIMSGVIQYPADDDFAQSVPVDISIGSNECTIDLYCIRVYDNDLTRSQVLDNWIADTQAIEVMLPRYNRNQIYDAYGNVVMSQLPSDLPYLILECAELPQYKGDKKNVSGSYIDPVNEARSFTFTDAQFDVQGTSSQYYERKNYKAKFKNGFVMSNGSSRDVFRIRENSVPVSTFCFKADVASSEGANNVELARLYNDACPYKTPGQLLDDRVRQGIDGFPIVIFWHDLTKDETVFMGKYNWNNDKSTEETFGFQAGDESWEVRNNTSDRVVYKSADYSGDDWLNDFEARFPDTDPPFSDPSQLREFAEWLVQTDTEKASGEELPEPITFGDTVYTTDSPEYRLAKFKAEAGNYMELDSAMFYYIFTELFLMVDSRGKNMFPSFMGGTCE